MSATAEAYYPEENSYAEDDFEDDFESEDTFSSSECTPHQPAPADQPHNNTEELTPSRSHNSSDSACKHSSAVAAVAVPANGLHTVDAEPHHSSAASRTCSSSFSSSSSSSSLSKSRESSLSSPGEHVSSHREHAEDADDHYAVLAENADAGAADAKLEEDNAAAAATDFYADELYDGAERCADGSAPKVHSHETHKGTAAETRKRITGRAARKHNDGDYDGHSARQAALNNTAAEQHHVQRPDVPQNAEELEAMLAENAKLRDQLFERNREHYHATLAQSMKGGKALLTTASAGTTGTMMTKSFGASGASLTHRDVAARLVQESLLAHRTLQMLRLEQRDLTQRRDELKKLISQYKRAAKYRSLIECVRQDIADFQEEHRDVQLEVRCNEKLLLLAEHMSESGVGDRRVQEEIRTQNALTQRRREHALRDADAAQRKYDAALQRVEELKAEVERRRQAAQDSRYGQSTNLLTVNRTKKDRIRELRSQLQELDSAGQASAASRQPRYRTQQSVRDDAEREYLQNRIAEMKRELNAAANKLNGSDSGKAAPVSSAGATTERSTSPATPLTKRTSPLPPPPLRASLSSPTPAEPEVNLAAPSASTEEIIAPKAETEEIDVTAWLNAHPVEATAAAPTQEHDMYPTSDSTGQNIYIPPVQHPPYTQEPAPESAPEPVMVPEYDESPAWINGGLEEEETPLADEGAANHPLGNSSSYPAMEQSNHDYFEEEDVADDKEDVQELDALAPVQSTASAPAPPEPSMDGDDGPDWLNF